MNDLDASKKWALKALEIDPKCASARTTYGQLQAKYKEHKEQQKNKMKDAFR